jgi:hypothetical protein
MSPRTWQRIKDVYTEASELAPEDRQAFVEGACGGQPDVTAEVLRLLRLDAEAERRMGAMGVPEGMLTAAADRHTFYPGERLAGRYEVRRFLASGGMGEVYEADDLERGERIAIKTIRPELARESHLGWLRREVDAARRVQHPNVCRVFDLVQAAPHTFLTMELLEGETLATYLQRHGSLTERQAMPWLRQIVAGLAAAHRVGVIHRDFKPGNVMIVPRANAFPRLVIMDFGLARHTASEAQATHATQISNTWSLGIGTPAYMAPEQIEGRKSTKASDIYSLGVVLFEMLTGELPFAGDSPLTMAVRKSKERPPSPLLFAPGLRSTWALVLQRCLTAKPGDRFDRVEEILPALETRSTGVLLVRRLGQKALRWLKPNAARFAISGLLFVVLMICWVLWPARVRPEMLAAWDRGVQALHSDEPLLALEHLEKASSLEGAPWRTHVDLALAWHALTVPGKAQAALRSQRTFLASPQDRLYLAAAQEWIAGHKPAAIQLLSQRAAAAPEDPQLLADWAWMASGPEERWRRVITLRPNYAAGHFQLADQAAKEGKWREAEGSFRTAQAFFQSLGMDRMLRPVAARQGLRRLESGDMDLARQELAGISALPATAGAGACEHVVVLMAGTPDSFALPADTIPYVSPRFADLVAASSQTVQRRFDEPAESRPLFFSIPLPPVRVCSAKLELHFRRGQELEGSSNDMITLGAAPFDNVVGAVERFALWADTPGEVERTIVADLRPDVFANAMRVYAGKPFASLDVLVGDDTSFDYVKLTIFY